jgi:branched-chain amino acid transport system permease protein
MLAAALSAGDLFSSAKVWGLAIVGLSFIPLVGYAGRLSLCQLTFAGVGAVVMAHTGASLLGLPLAAAVAALLGALVALPALRLSGIYMALATAAIAVAFDRWVFVLPAFSGFDLFDGGSLTIDRPGFLAGSTAFFLFGAVVFALVALVVVAVRRSRLGGRLLAMSDSERAAASLGIDLRRHTLAAFALSAAIAGVGGAVYGMAVQSTPPDPFSFFSGLPLLLFMVVIGVDSLAAAALAGLFLGAPLVPNLFPGFEQLTSLTVGVLAIVVGRHPHGIADTVRARIAEVRRSPVVLGGAIATCLAAWALCVADVLSQAAWLLITLAVISPLTVAVARRVQGRGAEADEDAGLSQPPELLGLTGPIGRPDVAILDRVLGLPRG